LDLPKSTLTDALEPPITGKTVLSDGEYIVDLTTTEATTQESEKDYDILVQGSDRQHPAIVVRRKHRGKGATIQTISRTTLKGELNPLYADYAEVIAGYLERRDNRRAGSTTGGHSTGDGQAVREAWVDKTLEGVVKGQDNSQRD
jgi:hypothetical protein